MRTSCMPVRHAKSSFQCRTPAPRHLTLRRNGHGVRLTSFNGRPTNYLVVTGDLRRGSKRAIPSTSMNNTPAKSRISEALVLRFVLRRVALRHVVFFHGVVLHPIFLHVVFCHLLGLAVFRHGIF